MLLQVVQRQQVLVVMMLLAANEFIDDTTERPNVGGERVLMLLRQRSKIRKPAAIQLLLHPGEASMKLEALTARQQRQTQKGDSLLTTPTKEIKLCSKQ